MAITIKLIGYFNDNEYNAICKYSNFLLESNEPYTFERSIKRDNVIILNGKGYKNATIILGRSNI